MKYRMDCNMEGEGPWFVPVNRFDEVLGCILEDRPVNLIMKSKCYHEV
jgi:hypothetical protein